MKLHQLKIDFHAEQDRLLMLVSTDDGAEVRMWLTRRFVKLLWPLLVKLAEDANPRITVQANPDARKALLGIEHQKAVQKADFSKPFTQEARSTPLGEEPLLLARIQTGKDPRGLRVVSMHPSSGQGLTLTLDEVLLHSVCRLLQAAVSKSQWDIELKLPGVGQEPAEAAEPRTLN